MSIVTVMGMLFLTLGLGILLRRADFFDEHTIKKLSALLVNITLPLLVVSSVAGMERGDGNVIKIFFLGLLCYVLYPIIGWIMVTVLKVPSDLRGTYVCFAVFSNNGFMGYPIVSSLFGESAIFHATIFHLAFSLSFFTVGIRWIRKDVFGDQAQNEAKEAKTGAEKLLAVRQILNNGVIAAVLAIAIYFAQIPIPQMIAETLRFVGNVSMPLSMMVLGSTMAGYSLKELIPNPRIIVMTLARLALLPFVTYWILHFFIDNLDLIRTLTITVGMPIATLVCMSTAIYDKQGKEAAVAVVFSTICSMASIPVMLFLLGA